MRFSRILSFTVAEIVRLVEEGERKKNKPVENRDKVSSSKPITSSEQITTLLVSSCSNTGSIRDDPYWTSRKNTLELIELSRN